MKLVAYTSMLASCRQVKAHKPVCRLCAQEDQSLLQAFEKCSRSALGSGPWMARFDAELVENLGRYRKYNQGSLRDLLRVIRNKHNHFRELPDSLQAKLGPPAWRLCQVSTGPSS